MSHTVRVDDEGKAFLIVWDAQGSYSPHVKYHKIFDSLDDYKKWCEENNHPIGAITYPKKSEQKT